MHRGQRKDSQAVNYPSKPFICIDKVQLGGRRGSQGYASLASGSQLCDLKSSHSSKTIPQPLVAPQTK